jgi:tyrosyl-tRNA synthetase
MYGKVMSISDALMWRYWELLTDTSMQAIEQMKKATHPMMAKKGLAAKIVADFHSEAAAKQGSEDWEKQFQKRETPETVEEVEVLFEEVAIDFEEASGVVESTREPVLHGDGWPLRVDKILTRGGLVSSGTEGSRMVKQRAVTIDGELHESPKLFKKLEDFPVTLTVKAGRKMRKITITRPKHIRV